MPNGQVNDNSNASNSGNPLKTATSSSPWEEDLDVSEVLDKKNPNIVGSLEGQDRSQSKDTGPFEVPSEVEEKVGKETPATNFVDNPNQTDPIKTSQEEPKKIQPAISATEPQVKPEPQSNIQTQPQQDVTLNDIKKPTNTPVSDAPIPTPVPQDLQTEKETQQAPSTSFTDSAVAAPESLPQNYDKKIQDELGVSPVKEETRDQGNKKIISSIGSRIFGRKDKKEIVKPSIPSSEMQTQKQVVQSHSGGIGKTILWIILGAFAMFGSLIALTELGLISLGVENVYGALKIEQAWGGLPVSSEKALIYSAVSLNNHPNYKVKGTLNLTIDSSIESSITSPVVSQSSPSIYAWDDRIAAPILAIKTVTTIDDYYDIETDTKKTESKKTDTTEVDNGGVESTTNNTETSENNAEESTSKNINAEVLLKSSQESAETTISFYKDLKKEEIKIVNDKDDLYVLGSENIQFNGNTDSDKWVKYQIKKLADKVITSDFFSIEDESGFSVEGSRVGNEKIGKVRSYKYHIDSLEIGNALEDVGIDSDFMQTVTGDIWIGVKDKLIRKVDLKITTPISSSVSMIEANLEFYDYDQENDIIKISDIDIVGGGEVETSADKTRKKDVDNILQALKDYKKDNNAYPISSDLLNLTTQNNIVERALVSDYLSSLPSDSKENWYYAYKSDGKTCSVSARLENENDSEGQKVGDLFLYLKYNNE